MSEIVERLKAMRGMFQYWLDWNLQDRTKENLETSDDTAIIAVPPHWPYRGGIKTWIEALDLAGARVAELEAENAQRLKGWESTPHGMRPSSLEDRSASRMTETGGDVAGFESQPDAPTTQPRPAQSPAGSDPGKSATATVKEILQREIRLTATNGKWRVKSDSIERCAELIVSALNPAAPR